MENPKCNTCRCFWKPDETDIKPSGLFYKTCKRCRNKSKQRNKKYYENNPDKYKKYYEENADKIIEKQKKYYEDNIDKIKEYKKTYNKDNIVKIKEKNKKYYDDNIDKIKEQSKKYREYNADKIKEQSKKYRDNNKCEHNKAVRSCKICNLPLYLLNLQRLQLWKCLKSSNQNKTKSSIEYLGCDADYFKDYIQKKMDIYNETAEVKMDFSNIHIDHIKPISTFNLDDEEEFLDCCNYTNLQPLLANDNLSKFNKWTDDDNKYWNENIKGKEHLQIFLNVI
jgi:hypothetical protein